MESRRTAALWLWLFNIALGALVGLSYLEAENVPRSPVLWLFAHLGLVSTVATLALVPGSFLWLAARAGLRSREFGLLAALAWMLFQLALVIDTRVWGLFRYHFNSAAWNLITTRGSEDSYRLGPRVWTVGLALAALFFALELLAWRWLAGSAEHAARSSRWHRPASVAVALLVLAVGIEKTIYAGAELQQDARVSALSRAFPLYPRVSVVPMLPEPYASDLGPAVPIASEGATLRYPLERPELAPAGPRPNVLILVIDSWRGDMSGPDDTPALAARAPRARVFADHYSGGNGTRFGVFSMLYGLHGSYWWPVLEAGRPPVLLDTLLAAGYEPGVFSSASMDYPEFRRTVPLKAMCSSKWATPLIALGSWRAPTPTQAPTETVSTDGMAAVTTRRPEGSVVISVVMCAFGLSGEAPGGRQGVGRRISGGAGVGQGTGGEGIRTARRDDPRHTEIRSEKIRLKSGSIIRE